MIGQLVYSFLEEKLKNSKNGYEIFEQDWMQANFEVRKVSEGEGEIKYQISCNISFRKSE